MGTFVGNADKVNELLECDDLSEGVKAANPDIPCFSKIFGYHNPSRALAEGKTDSSRRQNRFAVLDVDEGRASSMNFGERSPKEKALPGYSEAVAGAVNKVRSPKEKAPPCYSEAVVDAVNKVPVAHAVNVVTTTYISPHREDKKVLKIGPPGGACCTFGPCCLFVGWCMLESATLEIDY